MIVSVVARPDWRPIVARSKLMYPSGARDGIHPSRLFSSIPLIASMPMFAAWKVETLVITSWTRIFEGSLFLSSTSPVLKK